MDNLDRAARDTVKQIYEQLAKEEVITVSAPEYKKTIIDYLVKQGLLAKTDDVSTLAGWAYMLEPTYEGETVFAEISNSPLSKVETFIEQGEVIMKEEYHHITDPGIIMVDYIGGPKSDQWFSEIGIFNSRVLVNHPLHAQIAEVCKNHNTYSSHTTMMGHLRALAADNDFWKEYEANKNATVIHDRKTIEQMLSEDIKRCEKYLSNPNDDKIGQQLYVDITSRYDSIISDLGNGLLQYYDKDHYYDSDISGKTLLNNLRVVCGKMRVYLAQKFSYNADASNYECDDKNNKKVFIVHGHDNEAKQELARVLEKSGFEAIILHEQPNSGKTIIEKIEKYTDVGYAIILYTECDKGRSKDEPVEKESSRARQNVVFEHGYLIAKLGRDHVCALIKGDVETPGDISGVVYINMDESGAWKMSLAKDMQDVGLPVDMNKFCR